MPTRPAIALDRFVPRVACEWDLDAPGARWRELDGSLCFVDISGFTALSERLAMRGRIGVEELTDVLNRVFGTMLDIAFQRGGSLLKFGGDALLLLFDGDDHPRQAAAAAVEMRAALRAATQVPMSVGKVQLRMSVGLHSGTVQLFRVGTLHHELIVTGPAATRTTQMEHAASAGEIFVSPEMARRLPLDATRPGPSETMVLRWRRAPVAPSGARVRRQVPADTIDACLPEILREHLRPGEVDFEHRIAAVAFIRFRGVDALLASAGPDALADALHAVVSTVQRAADDAGVAFLASDIDEDGGKIILVSGVPRAQADHEGRLLRALRSIADADLPLPLQIGVNDGHVFAGTIGAAHRATFTVMGDTVNLAARLMSAAPHGELYATAGVLDRSRPIFATRTLEPFSVKGKSQPVQAYAVDDETGTRETAHQEGPFIGRQTELQQVTSVLQRVGGEDEAVLTIVGETGMGKTRLVSEALAATAIGHFTVRGEPDGMTSSYRAFRDSMRALLGVERADQATMAATLAAAVERLAPDLLPMLPLLGTVAHVHTPSTPEVDAIEPRFLPDQIAAAVLRLFDGALGESVVLAVEDAQWTDGASNALLTRLATAVRQRKGWSMLVLRRAVDGGFEPRERRLELGAMDDGALRELLVAISPIPLRPDEVQRIVSRAAGSPLVLDALVRLGRERGALDDLPDSLEALIAAEIDVLSPFPRLLLGYASVLGRSFNPKVWRQLLVDDGIEIDEGVTAELKTFVHFDAAGSARFRQAVVRDVAYRGLPYRRRRELHLRAGQVMEAVAAGAVDSVADLLSLHFFEGGDPERAWEYARLAGGNAQAAYANNDAASLYRRALEAGRRLADIDAAEQLSTWTALGDALEQAGMLEDALDAYRRATSLARGDDVQRARLLLKRARARERSGAFVVALRELRSAERVLEGDHRDEADRVRLTAATLRARVHQGQEQPRRALAVALRAAAEATRLGDLRELADAYSVIDWAHVVLGELDQAVHQPRIVEIHEKMGEPHRLALALGNQGAVHYWMGRWDEAAECYQRAHDAYVLTGDVVQAAMTQGNLAELLINRGELAAARAAIVEAAQTHRAVGFVDGALFDEIQLGRLYLGEGDPAEASQILAAVLDEASRLSLHETALQAAVYLAQCRLIEGRAEDALEILASAEKAAGSDAAIFAASVALVRAEALTQRGDVDGARRERAAGISVAQRMRLQYELGLLLLLEDDRASQEEGQALLLALDVDPASSAKELRVVAPEHLPDGDDVT
jgi:class 3 adenylate cyclase/tetratricopeptide (TPR) repeat protein